MFFYLGGAFMKYDNNYILGLDLGVGSVGWSCVELNTAKEPKRIIAANSYIFPAEQGSLEERRNARGQRRLNRRKQNRVKIIKNLFWKKGLLEQQYVKTFWDTEFNNYDDPYTIKVKGLNEKLLPQELMIALVHYAKKRGFKSNRKKDEISNNSKSATEDQKLLYAISTTENELKEKNQTISQYILETKEEKGRILNTDGNYHIGIKRSMVEDEVTQLLDKQIEFNVIDEAFKEEYLNILLHQRSFSAGPDQGFYKEHYSIENMRGKSMDGNMRAPLKSPSYEIFKMMQDLCNVRYFEYNQEKREEKSLTRDEIQKIILLALNNKEIKYKVIKDVLGKERNIFFKGIHLVRKDYEEITKIKQEDPSVDDKIIRENYILNKKKLNNAKLDNYVTIKNAFKKIGIILGKDDIKLMDQITELLCLYKSDDEIISNMDKYDQIEGKDEIFKNYLLQLDTKYMKTFGKLSYELLYRLIPEMWEHNYGYSEAMSAIGYDHTNKKQQSESSAKLPNFDIMMADLDLHITNRKVVSTIKNTKDIINKLIAKYGRPYAIHIEMSRDLTKTDREAKQCLDQSYANRMKNISLKTEILNKFNQFDSIEDISYQDLLKYKLFKEQQGICPYTLAQSGDINKAKIFENRIFSDEYEVDHIVPYSKCFDDRYCNKVLVKKAANQEKRDRLPLQYFDNEVGIGLYQNWVNNNIQSYHKRKYLLATDITDDMKQEFSARAINDTRYIATEITKILRYYFGDVKIRVYNGQLTDKVKGIWGLKNLTHSYQSSNYVLHQEYDEQILEKYSILNQLSDEGKYLSDEAAKVKKDILKFEEKRDQKNRNNHLHHALDATIIACLTDSLNIRIAKFEQGTRQIKQLEKYNKPIKLLINNVDSETGEVSTEEQLIDSKHALFEQCHVDHMQFPRPYPEFTEEVKYRIFERDEARMKQLISELNNYKENYNYIKEAKVLNIAHRCDKKVTGRLHKETIYGVKPSVEDPTEMVITNRVNIDTNKFNLKTIDKLYDKDGSQKEVYDVIKKWLGHYSDGEKAKKAQGLPMCKNGTVIRKVKLDTGAIKEQILINKEQKQYVAKDEVVRVDVYKRHDDDKLYFVGMDRYRCANEHTGQNLLLWHGQAKNNLLINENDLDNLGFTKVNTIYKNQVIKVNLRNGKHAMAKSVGFSSGKFEVKSLIGDNYDLYEGINMNPSKNRCSITVSTIESIEMVKTNILGEVLS